LNFAFLEKLYTSGLASQAEIEMAGVGGRLLWVESEHGSGSTFHFTV
jgi:hypothetical protein